MARKTDEERVHDLEKKIEQTKAKKQQIANRLREKKRKERTRRLIQVGAIFEKYFDYKDEGDGLTPEKAEQIALALSGYVKENKEKIKTLDVERSKENKKLVYQETKKVN